MTLREQLRRDEGLRLKPYHDTEGVLTIGYGRNLDAVGISQDEAEVMLTNDIEKARAGLIIALPWSTTLSEERFAVLLNMAYNLGLHGLMQFRRMLAAAEAGDYEQAAYEMGDSKWAGQVGPRAVRLARQMRNGQWV